MRINIPTLFVTGGPMEAGRVTLKEKEVAIDLVDANVSPALRAYAAMVTNASKGAVRDVSQIES